MKKINFRKIFQLSLWVFAIAGLITALGFVTRQEKSIVGKGVIVHVDNSTGEYFVDNEDIMDFLRSRHDTIKGQKMNEIDVNLLEKALLTHPAIADADVSISIDGQMKINIQQREPILRIINRDGESYYIDNKAKPMPLSDNYSARVITVSGNIYEPYASRYMYNAKELATNKYLKDITLLDDVYSLCSYIQHDTLLNSLVQAVNVNGNKEFELYPAVGDHIIVFGSTENMTQKFEKLKIFYTEGLNNVNAWNKYATINLKFDGQVVCTKKPIEPTSQN